MADSKALKTLTIMSSTDNLHVFKKILMMSLLFSQFTLWHNQECLCVQNTCLHSFMFIYMVFSIPGGRFDRRINFLLKPQNWCHDLKELFGFLFYFFLTQHSEERLLGKTITWRTWIKLILNLTQWKPGNGGEFNNLFGCYSVFILVITSLPLHTFP